MLTADGGKAKVRHPTNLGPDWWKWLIAVYLWHIVYGFNLGAFYQPLPTASPAGD